MPRRQGWRGVRATCAREAALLAGAPRGELQHGRLPFRRPVPRADFGAPLFQFREGMVLRERLERFPHDVRILLPSPQAVRTDIHVRAGRARPAKHRKTVDADRVLVIVEVHSGRRVASRTARLLPVSYYIRARPFRDRVCCTCGPRRTGARAAVHSSWLGNPALRGGAAVMESGMVRFRGALAPRVPAEAGVPSRVGCTERWGAEGFGCEGGEVVRFRRALAPRVPAEAGVPSRVGCTDGWGAEGFGCDGGEVVRFRGALAPRVPAEAGVPSRGAVPEGGVPRGR